MKIAFLFIGFFAFFSQGFSSSEGDDDSSLKFKVYEQDYTFSTVYEMGSGEGLMGSVSKSVFHIRTNYDLYDKKGAFEAVGICRVLTLGLIYSWATEMDLYDSNGQHIGVIDGQLMTSSQAKFSIYDSTQKRVGIAYLDNTCSAFTIVDPDNERHILASLKRNFVADTIDNWEVSIYERDVIDVRIIKIFSAFAVDTQKDFKEDR